MRTVIAALLLLIASPVLAAQRGCPSGTLTPTPLASIGATSTDTVGVGSRSQGLVFQAIRTAGTATVQIDICCSGTCDPATGSWAQVENSPMAVDGTTTSLAKSVIYPACQYRAS